MINKLFTPCLAFVCVLGGLSTIFTSSVNATALAIMLVAYILVATLGFYICKYLRPLKITKIAVSVWSLLSCSFSVTVAADLVVRASVLHKDYFPFVVIMTAAFCVIFALSPRTPVKSVTLVCAGVSLLAFIVIIILSVLDTDFSYPELPSPTVGDFFPVSLVAILDVFLIFKMSKHKTPISYLAGGICAFVLLLVITLVSVSVLSPKTYYSLESPLLKLWQSTYITSFINRFEIVSVTALYLITALKAAIVLRPCLENSNARLKPVLVISVFLLCIPFSFL
ncbi:MAG: hypothetical protein IJ408_02685 [Clostridia bacterium]|nr:hypothetical protein [Clostridia bacterium]